MSRRDFVRVAETPNFAKLEMIFFKSTSFAIFSTSTFLLIIDVSKDVKFLHRDANCSILLLLQSYHSWLLLNLSFMLQFRRIVKVLYTGLGMVSGIFWMHCFVCGNADFFRGCVFFSRKCVFPFHIFIVFHSTFMPSLLFILFSFV